MHAAHSTFTDSSAHLPCRHDAPYHHTTLELGSRCRICPHARLAGGYRHRCQVSTLVCRCQIHRQSLESCCSRIVLNSFRGSMRVTCYNPPASCSLAADVTNLADLGIRRCAGVLFLRAHPLYHPGQLRGVQHLHSGAGSGGILQQRAAGTLLAPPQGVPLRYAVMKVVSVDGSLLVQRVHVLQRFSLKVEFFYLGTKAGNVLRKRARFLKACKLVFRNCLNQTTLHQIQSILKRSQMAMSRWMNGLLCTVRNQNGRLPLSRAFHVRVMLPCYRESLELIQATAYATIRAELPAGCSRTVYICDDGKDEGILHCSFLNKLVPYPDIVHRLYMPPSGMNSPLFAAAPST